jgi:four helix bundle protein
MNNSAEGFGRQSDKEFDYFLNIAKGSALEVKSMYYIASDLGYVNEITSKSRREDVQMVINSISKLKKYLKKI